MLRPVLAVSLSLVLMLTLGCGKQDGPKLPSGTGPTSAQNTTPTGGNPPVAGTTAHSTGEGDECCPSDTPSGPAAGPVTGNEEGHACCCSELKPGCKCGHCSGAIPVCHCKHDKKPGGQ